MADARTAVEERTTAEHTNLLCIHGFTCSWRNWDPVVDGLRAHHRVHLARLAGHRDGPALPGGVAPTARALADQLERDLDEAGVDRAHLVGNSLGGWLSMELAARGRALSVTALAPALGWEPTGSHLRTMGLKLALGRQVLVRSAPLLRPLFRSGVARRSVLKLAVEHGDRMSADAALSVITDVAACTLSRPLRESFLTTEHTLGTIDCPVRIAWPDRDALIPRDPYGARFTSLVPHAEHLILRGVGHVPMYDDPELVIRTVLETTGSVDRPRGRTHLEPRRSAT